MVIFILTITVSRTNSRYIKKIRHVPVYSSMLPESLSTSPATLTQPLALITVECVTLYGKLLLEIILTLEGSKTLLQFHTYIACFTQMQSVGKLFEGYMGHIKTPSLKATLFCIRLEIIKIFYKNCKDVGMA